MESQSLNKSELQKTLDLCPSSVLILNKEGYITFANQKAIKTLGLTASEIFERPYNSAHWNTRNIEGRVLEDDELPFSRVMQSKQPVEGVKLLVNFTEEVEAYISLDAHPILSNDEFNGVILTIKDISELVLSQKEAMLKQTDYRNLFNNLIDEVHLWKIIRDEQGGIHSWELIDLNPAAEKTWQRNREEVVGKKANEIFGKGTDAQFRPIVEKIFRENKPYSWEEYFEPTDQYLSMTSIPFDDYFISTGRDITEKKMAEQRLIKANEKAEEANQLKTDFLQRLEKGIHEERERISKVLHDSIVQQLVVTTMRLNNLKSSDQKQERAIQELKSTIKSITDQVRDLSHHLHATDVEGFDLEQLFERLEQQVAMYHLVDFEFSLGLNGQTIVISDQLKTHFYRITQELIMNIIKHSGAKKAQVKLETDESHLCLMVEDNGVGFQKDGVSQGIGLQHIEERVKWMQGELKISGENGFRIEIRVPLED